MAKYPTTEMILRLYLDDNGDKNFLKEPIEILAWSWGSGSGMLQDLSMTKYIGLDTPLIMKLISTGAKIPRATLTCQNDNKIVMSMRDAQFTHQSMGGSGGESRLTENVVLAFAEIEMLTEFAVGEGRRESKASVAPAPVAKVE